MNTRTQRQCCNEPDSQTTTSLRRLARGTTATAKWILPGAVLALMPKCPACLAAYIGVATGLGLSFSLASTLRWSMIMVCLFILAYLLAKSALRICRHRPARR